MNKDKESISHCITSMEISSFDGDNFIPISEVLTHGTMPVGRQNIPRHEDLKQWPYLKDVKISEIDSSVDLPIGMNVLKALEPIQIVRSQGDGPYAMKTRLGSVIYGSLKRNHKIENQMNCPAIAVNQMSTDKVEKPVMKPYNHVSNESTSKESEEMSNEELKFMDVMNYSVKTDEHCCGDLPFKQESFNLPNNCNMAEQHTQTLKRKFGEKKFHERRISLKNNFYKDDCLKSRPTEQEAILPVEHLTSLCNKGGFILSKWASDNCESIPLDDRAKETRELDLDKDDLPMERALGVTNVVQLKYVDTEGNPGKEVSRELTVNRFLSEKKWIDELKSLCKPDRELPKLELRFEISAKDSDIKSNLTVNFIIKDSVIPLKDFQTSTLLLQHINELIGQGGRRLMLSKFWTLVFWTIYWVSCLILRVWYARYNFELNHCCNKINN